MQKQKIKDKKIIIYNKWDFLVGIIVLSGASFVLSICLFSTPIILFWFPLMLGTALGMSSITFFTETGWYINTIVATIAAIGGGIFSIPLSAMSSNQINIIILVIGIAFFGNSFGFGISMLSRCLKEKR